MILTKDFSKWISSGNIVTILKDLHSCRINLFISSHRSIKSTFIWVSINFLMHNSSISPPSSFKTPLIRHPWKFKLSILPALISTRLKMHLLAQNVLNWSSASTRTTLQGISKDFRSPSFKSISPIVLHLTLIEPTRGKLIDALPRLLHRKSTQVKPWVGIKDSPNVSQSMQQKYSKLGQCTCMHSTVQPYVNHTLNRVKEQLAPVLKSWNPSRCPLIT